MDNVTRVIVVNSDSGDLEFSVSDGGKVQFVRTDDGTEGLFSFELTPAQWEQVCSFINRELKEPF